MKKFYTLLTCFVLCISTAVQADEVHLKNGDKLTGDIIDETSSEIIFFTPSTGEISINLNYVDKYVTTEEIAAAKRAEELKAASDVKWTRKFSVGYSETGGNTEKNSFSSEVNINRKTQDDEWTAKWTAYLGRNNDKLDAKKFYGLARYDQNFGDKKEWYHFYKFEADADRFANVNYRLTPSGGIGHWFKNEDDFKLKVEGALGYEHTNYRDNTKSDNEVILVPRAYFEKKIYKELRLTEDLTIYPSLSESGEFRLHSETSLVNPISDKINWKTSVVDDYDSNPTGSSKSNDYRIVTGLDITF